MRSFNYFRSFSSGGHALKESKTKWLTTPCFLNSFFSLSYLVQISTPIYHNIHILDYSFEYIYIYKQLLKKVTINKFKKKKLQKIKGEDVKGGAIYHENVGPLS